MGINAIRMKWGKGCRRPQCQIVQKKEKLWTIKGGRGVELGGWGVGYGGCQGKGSHHRSYAIILQKINEGGGGSKNKQHQILQII